eukprot:5479751-Prymnesium_polylepis.1
MAATSERGTTGFLRCSDLSALRMYANVGTKLGTALDELLRAVEDSEGQLGLPQWLGSARAIDSHPRSLWDARLVAGTLLHLCTKSQHIQELFDRYSIHGAQGLGLAEWVNFVRSEQIASPVDDPQGSAESYSVGPSSSASQGEELSVALRKAQQIFERAVDRGGDLHTDATLNQLQFALQLLGGENNAAAPASAFGMAVDLRMPLTHYWNATSHNSCISAGI